MSTKTTYPHLTIDDKGHARIGTTRYKVVHLAAEHYQHGWTAEELMRNTPTCGPRRSMRRSPTFTTTVSRWSPR